MTLSKTPTITTSVSKSTEEKVASVFLLDPNNNIVIRNGPQNLIPRLSANFMVEGANALTSGFKNDMHTGGYKTGWPAGMPICGPSQLECFTISIDNDHWGASPPSSNPSGDSIYRFYKDGGSGSVLQDTITIANTSFTSHTSPGTLAVTTWISTVQTFGSLVSFSSGDILYITSELDNVGMTSNGAEIVLILIMESKP